LSIQTQAAGQGYDVTKPPDFSRLRFVMPIGTSAETTLDATDPTPVAPPEEKSVCRLHLREMSLWGSSVASDGLLQTRLRIASLCLFAGFALFLLWQTVSLSEQNEPLHIVPYLAHVGCTVLLGTMGYLLYRPCVWQHKFLRLFEVLTFLTPTAYFAMLQVLQTEEMLQETQHLPTLPARWALIAFTYAMFIPNHWRRALVVLGTILLTPLVVLVCMIVLDSHIRAAAMVDMTLTETALQVSLALGVAVVGVRTINALRQEVFAAKRMGQYRLLKLLGSGGMGDVFLAEHDLLKRPCAVKTIHPAKAGDPRVLARFEREVQATARLSHWNTINIFDYGRADDGTFYYVMEFLPGKNLMQLVEEHGPLPPGRAIHLIHQACDGLREAHKVGLIHRDIKPANVFAAEVGGLHDVAKLLDFGLAKPLSTLQNESLTQEGAITGSPLFMSPEQASGELELDARSDVYSMGAVLFYILTGRAPFSYDKPLKILAAHIHEQPPGLRQFRPELDPELESVVLRCLAKVPAERFQSAEDLGEALSACRDANTWDWQQAETWWQREGKAGMVAEVKEELQTSA